MSLNWRRSGRWSLLQPCWSRLARKFTAITGGGVIPLNGILTTVLALEEKEPGRDYILMSGDLAVTLNAIGTLFGLYFYIGSLRRREAR